MADVRSFVLATLDEAISQLIEVVTWVAASGSTKGGDPSAFDVVLFPRFAMADHGSEDAQAECREDADLTDAILAVADLPADRRERAIAAGLTGVVFDDTTTWPNGFTRLPQGA